MFIGSKMHQEKNALKLLVDETLYLKKGLFCVVFSRMVELTEENLKKRETSVTFPGRPQKTMTCLVRDIKIRRWDFI